MSNIPKFAKQDIISVQIKISEVFASAAFPSGAFYQLHFSGEIKTAMTREKDGGRYGQGYIMDELKSIPSEVNLTGYRESDGIANDIFDDKHLPENFSGDYSLNIEEKSLYVDIMCRQENFKTVFSVLSLSNKSKNLQLSVSLKPNDDQKIKLPHCGLVYAWSLSNSNNFLNNE